MSYAGINLFAVLIAASAAMLFGILWYALVLLPRTEAIGSHRRDIFSRSRQIGWTGFIGALLAKTIMAFCLARLLVAFDAVSAGNGVALGLYLWIGFVATTVVVTHRFEHRRWRTTALDALYWLIVMIIEGATIGFLA